MRMRLDVLVPCSIEKHWIGRRTFAYQRTVKIAVGHKMNTNKEYIFQHFQGGTAIQVWKVIRRAKKKRGTGYLKNGRGVRLPKRFVELLKSWYVLEGLRTP